MKKKSLSIAVVKVLSEIRKVQSEQISVGEGKNYIIVFEDSDSASDFQFCIRSEYMELEKVRFSISHSPYSEVNASSKIYNVTPTNLVERYIQWQNLVLKYNDYNIEYQDPIVEHYSDEFFTNYHIVGEDGDVPFSTPKLLALDAHIDRIIEVVKSNIGSEEAEEIIQNCQDLKDTMTKSTKNQVLKKLSMIHSKVMYHGLKLLKAIWDETFKQLIKLGVTGGLNELSEFL